ncbi:HD domain-containing protein [Chitinophaga sancti]|uniref:HD domain-containing protein n=1 Tax=Chitinophaga sancti TaxID=1004 RepID=A0A1K1MWG8_9BACT|nr:HD domain-containing protein [Chitinophaga sancti]WQD63046.1 HD domain-containing protein [Chitinophaga sancti]WQG91329.1 HD domain-containing protein [Chitinophaga sancti]SFW27409.1 Predicted metal-dependent phosphohydrolase, HD superfamily [Chitinophaga sancti]
MENAILLMKIESYVRNLFAIHQQSYLYYHNLSHTERVAEHTAIMSAYYQLGEGDHFILMTAAWFHDTGHLFGEMEKHEERSTEVMMKFLGETLPAHIIEKIQVCIMATKMPVHPMNLLEMILCDADTWHLGTKEFWREDARVWQELEARKGRKFENKVAMSLKFMQQHQFYTTYCLKELSRGKEKNEALLIGK